MSERLLLTARSVMHHPVQCVEEGELLVRAARRLAKKGWSGAPVVDAGGALVGILSEADVVHALSSAAFYETPPPTRVGEVMSTEPRTVGPDADLFQLVTLVSSGGQKRVPVVENGKPIGLVTRRDVMKILVDVVEERWGKQSVGTYEAIAAREGTHTPYTGR